jgi:hypothetical protein
MSSRRTRSRPVRGLMPDDDVDTVIKPVQATHQPIDRGLADAAGDNRGNIRLLETK